MIEVKALIKLWLYCLNTFLIQILGELNLRMFPYTKRLLRRDRLGYVEYYDNDDGFGMVASIACCDCGASHYIWKANEGIYGSAIRPDGYNYKPRLKEEAAFADKEAKARWDTNR